MALEAQGAKLEMETGTGDAVATVTAAVGYPTIITKNAHGLSNGDVVATSLFAGDSAELINALTLVVKNVTTNTLALDVDTTGGSLTPANGTLTPVEWSEVGEVVDMNLEDPGATEINTTHLQSTAKEYLMGLEDAGSYTFSVNWLFTDAGQEALRTAKTSRALKNFRVTYSDDSTATFSAYVQTFTGPSLGVDDKMSGSITLKISGAVAFA